MRAAGRLHGLAVRRLACAWLVAVMLCVPVPAVAEDTSAPDLSAFEEKYIILADASAPTEALYGLEKDADELCYPASTTKILACLAALEYGDLNAKVTVSEYALDLSNASARMGVRLGEQYTLRDLIYGMMLPSGNDAARAVAEGVSGSEEAFAGLMNKIARSIGMEHSHFTNASGLHDDNHYTTARDMAILMSYAAQNEALCRILQTKTYDATELLSGRNVHVRNIDRLVNDPRPRDEYTPISCLYEYAIGGKTGSTLLGGLCFVAAARRDGVTLVAVLLGDMRSTYNMTAVEKDAVSANRFLEAVELFTYAYDRMMEPLTVAELAAAGMPLSFFTEVATTDGTGQAATVPLSVSAEVDTGRVLRMMPERRANVLANAAELAATDITPKTAPVRKGEVCGTVTYVYDGQELLVCDLIADVAIPVAELMTAIPASQPVEQTVQTLAPATEKPAVSGGVMAALAVAGTLILAALFLVYRALRTPRRRRSKRAKNA